MQPTPASLPPPLKLVVEALLFSAQKPLTARDVRDLLNLAAQDESAPEAAAHRKVKEDTIEAILTELEADHATAGRSYRLIRGPAGWQFASQPEFGPWLRALLGRKPRPARLTQPAIETLTIIAYRQPVTRAEVEQIRGVSVDGVMQTLLERGLIEAVGRAEVVGRPITYGTTQTFLEYFGIRAIEDLPAADELRRLPVEKPEALLTVDPGLATAPPDALRSQESAPAAEAEAKAPSPSPSSPPPEPLPPSSIPSPTNPAAPERPGEGSES